MLEEIRCCAGGAVFHDGKVFLIREADGAWAMPKGVIRDHMPSNRVARWRVEDEAGIQMPVILGVAGYTFYRLYSKSRDREVMNRIQWFAMKADSAEFHINREQGFLDGGWFDTDEAEEMLTRPMDAEILRKAALILRTAQEKAGD